MRTPAYAQQRFVVQAGAPSFAAGAPSFAAGAAATRPAGQTSSSSSESSNYTGLTPQAQTALFNNIGAGLAAAGTTAAAIVNSNNQADIERLRSATSVRVAELANEAALARAQGDTALANQRSAEAARLQEFQLQLGTQQNNNFLYLGLAVAGVALVGVLAFVMTRQPSGGGSRSSARANPSRRRRRSRRSR